MQRLDVRMGFHLGLQERDGALVLLHPHAHLAVLVAVLDAAGLESDRLLQVRERLLLALGKRQGDAEPELGRRVAGPPGDVRPQPVQVRRRRSTEKRRACGQPEGDPQRQAEEGAHSVTSRRTGAPDG